MYAILVGPECWVSVGINHHFLSLRPLFFNFCSSFYVQFQRSSTSYYSLCIFKITQIIFLFVHFYLILGGGRLCYLEEKFRKKIIAKITITHVNPLKRANKISGPTCVHVSRN